MIKLYTKTVCPKCIVAKAMLEDSGVVYEAFNIDTDNEAKQVLVDKGFMAVPIAEHDGNFFTSNEQIQGLIEELK